MVFRIAVILIAVVFGWTYVSRSGDRDRMDERRALDHRAAELVGRAIAPGSAIACLEATNTETVEGSCERAVFASPETVAAATAYMAARLSLLADASEFTARRDQSYEAQIAGLRRTVAADRYGLSSQVLATRDGCTTDACDAFSLVYDDKKLRANMKDRLFDITVARYAANWPTRGRPLASGGPTSMAPAPSIAFPAAQSLPPVIGAEPAAPIRAIRAERRDRIPHPCRRPIRRRLPPPSGRRLRRLRRPPRRTRRRRRCRSIRQPSNKPQQPRCLSRRLALRLAHVHLGPDRQSRRNRRPHHAYRTTPRLAGDRGPFGSGCRRAACAARRRGASDRAAAGARKLSGGREADRGRAAQRRAVHSSGLRLSFRERTVRGGLRGRRESCSSARRRPRSAPWG